MTRKLDRLNIDKLEGENEFFRAAFACVLFEAPNTLYVIVRFALKRLLLVSCACSTLFYAQGSMSGQCIVPSPPTYTTFYYTYKYMNSQTSLSTTEYSTQAAACTASAVVWPGYTGIAYQLISGTWPYAGPYGPTVIYAGDVSAMTCAGLYGTPAYNYNLFTPWPVSHCPTGYTVWNPYHPTPCQLTDPALVTQPCNDNKNLGTGSCTQPTTTKPIVLGTGNKYLVETDYVGAGPFPLEFNRTYNSQQNAGGFGYNWRNRFGGNITTVGSSSASVYRPDGKVLTFTFLNSQWTPDADITDTLVQLPNATGWKYTTADGTAETYDAAGRRTSFTNRAGLTQTYTLSDGTTGVNGGVLLDANGNPTGTTLPIYYALNVKDQTGRKISFGYGYNTAATAIHVVTMTDPSGGQYLYGYDANDNLTSVSYPDDHKRLYLYETNTAYTSNATQPHVLTGIVDTTASDTSATGTSGTRYASYWYDTQGRAVKEELAQPTTGPDPHIAQNQLAYTVDTATGNPTKTVVTDALLTARTYNFQTILGVVKSTGTDQPGGSGCGLASSAISYDTTNGNVLSRADFNQHKTCYAYDAQGRNLETARAEGITGTCPADLAAWTPGPLTIQRKISTQWHTYWRLPAKVAEPKRFTTWVYNGDTYQSATVSCAPPTALIGTQPIGVLCKKIVQATTDSTGAQGLGATIDSNIASRIWSYTYDGNGQVLTIDGPRPHTDVDDITSYTYYSTDDSTAPIPKFRHGDLQSITDALGHVTQITSYDGNGRPLTIIDPNIVTTTLTYWPRGWLKSKSIGSKTTNYIYDNVGNLTQVTLADGSFIKYTFDAAHRLTDIWDASNNHIKYTLDAIGNRTLEEVFDANSVLSTKKGRDFDALNRLWHDITYFNNPNDTNPPKTLYTYDPNGNLTTVTPPANSGTDSTYRKTTFDFDVLDRLANTGDPVNTISNPTHYVYDGLDQLKSVTLPLRRVNPTSMTTSYGVTALGDVTQENSPEHGTTNQTFDEAGNLKTGTDARGSQVSYVYDALNRPISASYLTAGEDITFLWDAGTDCIYGIGRLCQVTDAAGRTRFAYDDQGNLVKETRLEAGVTLVTQYGFDGANRLTSLINPAGENISLSRTNLYGRIDSVTTINGTITNILEKQISYDGAGQVTSHTLGNGIVLKGGYDLSGQPLSEHFNKHDGDINQDGVVNIVDVLFATQIAEGLRTPTQDQLDHGDVAPAANPNGKIDVVDVMRILRKAEGIQGF